MRAPIVLALVLSAAVLAPCTASANDSAMGGAGGAVTPIGSSTVRMTAETVQVIVYQQFAEYRVDFEFDNSGAPQKVKLGFPFRLPAEEGSYSPPAAFRAWSGDTPLAVTYQEVARKDGTRIGYYLHEADLPGATTMVRVSYYAYHDSNAGSPPEGLEPPAAFQTEYSYHGAYPYTVSSGAGWAGTIGTSVIRYHLSGDSLLWGVDAAIAERAEMLAADPETPADAADTLKSCTRPARDVYQWTFTDFEPTPDERGRSAFDIALPFFIPAGASEFALPWMPVAAVKASSELKLTGHEYPAYAAVDGDPSTAWAEGTDGPGTGQWLDVSFPAKRHLVEIRVLPGYAKRTDLFAKYNRPKTLDVEFSDGTKTSLALADDPSVQRFPVDVECDRAKVTIGDVYKGTTRDETYLSSIEFATAEAPTMLSFGTVLSGGLAEPSAEPTVAEVTASVGASSGTLRFPQGWRDPGWPLFAACVGCGVLLGLLVGGVMVLVAKKRGKSAKVEAPVPGEAAAPKPPAEAPPPL